MQGQVISINNRKEQQANKHMHNRFNRRARAIRAFRILVDKEALELFEAGVNPVIVKAMTDHLREQYALNKQMAIGGNIDVTT